jgi:hypothetical protein
MKDLVERLPGRVNRILDAVANNELEVKVDAIDEARLMAGFQKVANRITLGLLLAALIISAAMLMRVDTSFRILGYPGLAIIFFFARRRGRDCSDADHLAQGRITTWLRKNYCAWQLEP